MKNLFVIVFVVAVGLFVWFWPQNKTISEPTTPAEVTEKTAPDILVTTPAEGDTITSPVQIRGQAVGSWFWEGTFTAEVTDQNGQILGTGFITNDPGADWMSEAPVPFNGEVEFTQPEIGTTGKLILRKANPSALPENNKELQIPVRFGAAQDGD